MEDKLLLATVAGGSARLAVAITTKLVNEAQRRHGTYPVATAALGRTLTAGLLLATNLKGEDSLTIRVLGDGPLGGIIVNSDACNTVRGYVQEPHTHLPSTTGGKLDVGAAVGKGHLYVTRDLGFGDPYTGSVELVTGEIAEDIAQYLTVSEQTPSAVSLGVLVESDLSVIAAGGFLLQMMPGAAEDTVDKLEKNLAGLQPITNLIASGQGSEDILQLVTEGLPVVIHEQRTINYQCKCSKERLERVLISLGASELQEIIDTLGKAELTCHFCAERYEFNRAELEDLLNHIKEKSS